MGLVSVRRFVDLIIQVTCFLSENFDMPTTG
ncbi:hypothetical protein P3T17_000355 [Paraburkholderia sp. GAS82]